MIFRGRDGRGDVYVSSFISIVCDFFAVFFSSKSLDFANVNLGRMAGTRLLNLDGGRSFA